MALNTTGDIIIEVLVRNNRTTTDAFITDQMLFDWTKEANNYCATQYKWPLSEVRDQTTSWSGTEEIPYTDFNINFKADSIRFMFIGDKRMTKLNFEDYKEQREDQASSTARTFTDFARILLINPNADVSGTIAAFGQYMPTILADETDITEKTIFSDFDEEGNEAIVEKMTAYLKRREHLPDEAELHDERADGILVKVWKKITDEQYKYKAHRGSDGMFQRFDVVEGGFADEIFRRNQF